MSQPFVGEIRMFAGNFAPRNFAFCNGQLMSIAQNTALFSLLGTTYGGNGQTTFGLPELRGRVPMHRGQGTGLSDRDLGEQGGVESVTLLTSEMPQHSHALGASTAPAAPTAGPPGSVTATASAPLYGPASSLVALGPALASAGGSQPHDNLAPYLCVSFIIALAGVFPARN